MISFIFYSGINNKFENSVFVLSNESFCLHHDKIFSNEEEHDHKLSLYMKPCYKHLHFVNRTVHMMYCV